MNIFAINSFNTNPYYKKQENFFRNEKSFGLTMAKPLTCDTVSFKAVTNKNMNIKNISIPMRDAINAHKEAAALQDEITNFFVALFEPYLANKKNPLNPIEYVRGRAKGHLSIWEKAKTRGWRNLSEVFQNMTDLNGVKCVLRDSSYTGANITLNVLLNAIKNKTIILEEVEVKRPICAKEFKKKEWDKYDYAKPTVIKKFIKATEDAQGKKVNFSEEPDYTESNYPAIHFLFRFPAQKRVIELQLMGHDVAVFKGMDDLFFKILNNKKVDDEFKPIEKLIKPLMKEGNEEYLNKFNEYRGRSFIYQREKEPATSVENSTEFFLPLKKDIPYRELLTKNELKKLEDNYNVQGNPYDFNNLYKIYKICRAEVEKSRENLLKN